MQENASERAERLEATHAPVKRAKADGRWQKSTEHQHLKLSLYSKGRVLALSVTNVSAAATRRDGAVTQMSWSIDLIYAVWISDESEQQEGNVCFNIILCDPPTVKSRTYTGTKQWQVVHTAPPSAVCAMSTTHAYLRVEIEQTIAAKFIEELHTHYSSDSINPNPKKHTILFSKPPSRSGWKKYNDKLLIPIRARHYERVSESLTTALGRWLQKWAKLKGEARKTFELDPWFVHVHHTYSYTSHD